VIRIPLPIIGIPSNDEIVYGTVYVME